MDASKLMGLSCSHGIAVVTGLDHVELVYYTCLSLIYMNCNWPRTALQDH